MSELDFTGQVVLVVGGSSGIGNGVAHAFKDRGATVHVWGTRPNASDYDGVEGSDLTGLVYDYVDVADRAQITAAAEKFMRRMVRFSDHPAGGFRLTVSPGGCSGYNSEFSVEAQPQAGDQTVLVQGLKVFLPAESRLMSWRRRWLALSQRLRHRRHGRAAPCCRAA